MRCLYCGKELALLKRLTGGGEFCSDAHKQSYQEEYNRLGLSRLLQARSKTSDSKAGQKPLPAPEAPVAVAEPPREEIAVRKVPQAPPPAQPPVIAQPPAIVAPPEAPPPAMAGFVMEAPAILIPAEISSYVEPWMSDDSPPPAAPAWGLEVP